MPHDHSHGHSGHHHHIDPAAGDRKVALAVAINLALTVAQVAGGIVSGSVALIADAMHNLSDAVALIIAFAARQIARRPATPQMSFGYGRAEVVAALVNYTTLIVISVWLGYEALVRLIDPPEVTGWIVVALAGFALIIDLITAGLTWRMAKDSMNIRAAFLHNLADAGTSVAEIQGALEDHAGVEGVHHLHLWQMDEKRTSLEAHLVLAEGAESMAIVAAAKARVAEMFGITHVTFEIETRASGCAGSACPH